MLFALPVFGVFSLLCTGCAQPEGNVAAPADGQATQPEKTSEVASATVPAGFGPARISILPLTELTARAEGGQGMTLHAYVALVDGFGTPIKAPGVLRFELYRYVPRSSEPKGQRIVIWPDIDLTTPARNNECWQDFLRAYRVQLDVPGSPDQPCILGVTCMCPDGKRHTAEFPLKTGE